MSFYQLKKDVFLVEGAAHGALLDTNTGSIYSINKEGCAVLNYEVEDLPYWRTLANMGLAEETTEIQKQSLPEKTDLNTLKFVWFEIVTDDCNERCAHCYADSMPRTYRNTLQQQGQLLKIEEGPQPLPENRPRMQHADWLQAIETAYALGCRSCQFVGGEPLLYKGPQGESVLDLVAFAKQLGYTTVEVYTNGTLLTQEKIVRLKELGAQVAVSLYSHDPAVHESITQTPGSHAKTVQALQWLKEYGVPTRAEIILMRQNQNTVETTLAFRQQLGLTGKRPDVLRPKGRGDNPLIFPSFERLVQYGLKLKPNFKASREVIAHYKAGNACLLGKITLTEFGDVLPCIFTRNHVIGNVLVAQGLRPVVESQAMHRIWQATKDNVLVCRDCEYRYVCFDCRPLSEGVAAGNGTYLNAPYPRCTYNPYTGQWGGGLWRVDDQGEPFYDTSLAPQIQQVAQSMTEYLFEETSH